MMAVVQSTYTSGVAFGQPGMVADGETSNRISRTVEDAAGIAFGKAVFRGTGDHGCTATPSATVSSQYGFSIANMAIVPYPGGVAADIYPQYSSAGILTLGEMWVNSAVAVADGDQVYITSAGLITNVLTSNTLMSGWYFNDTTTAAGLVRIYKR